MNPARRQMISLTDADLIHVAGDPSATAAVESVPRELLVRRQPNLGTLTSAV